MPTLAGSFGATTVSIMTLSIETLSIITKISIFTINYIIMTFIIKPESITTLSITVKNKHKLILICNNLVIFRSIVTLSVSNHFAEIRYADHH